MIGEAQPWLDYRLRGYARGANPGKHASDRQGSGGAFRGLVPFWQNPDAGRLDIRRSLMDPGQMPMVRQTDQASTLSLVVAVDLTASMTAGGERAGGERAGRRAAHAIAEAAARSALRAGDKFGLIGFDQSVRAEVSLAPTRARGAVNAALAALLAAPDSAGEALGLGRLAEALPRTRCLVLLISDFAMPVPLVEAAMTALHRHDVAPIHLLGDGPAREGREGAREGRGGARLGLARVRDAEGGTARLVLLRPALDRAWRAGLARHHQALAAVFGRAGRDAFSTGATPDLVALSDHLLAV